MSPGRIRRNSKSAIAFRAAKERRCQCCIYCRNWCFDLASAHFLCGEKSMRRLILGFFAVLAFAAASVAEAQTLRIPKSGEPALALAMPTNWTAKYDDLGNLQYSSADRSLNIQLSI